MMRKGLAVWILLVSGFFIVNTVAAQSATAAAKMFEKMHQQNEQHAGERLPATLWAKDRNGRQVNLSKVLQTPGWVVVIGSTPPAFKIIRYLRAHHGRSPQGFPVTLLSFGLDRALLRAVPTQIPFYNITSPAKSNFFHSTVTPAEFFFTQNKTLIGRSAGLTTPADKLTVPDRILKTLH